IVGLVDEAAVIETRVGGICVGPRAETEAGERAVANHFERGADQLGADGIWVGLLQSLPDRFPADYGGEKRHCGEASGQNSRECSAGDELACVGDHRDYEDFGETKYRSRA